MVTVHTARCSHPMRKWRSQACGGHSVVLSTEQPPRNDTRIPAYGYKRENGYSIGYPFIDDGNETRLDFVCFSHEDARLIAAAPELLTAVQAIELQTANWTMDEKRQMGMETVLQMIADAIAKTDGNGYACAHCSKKFVSVEARDHHRITCHD